MIHSSSYSVVLDACVLYPAPVRDILLSLASEGLYKPLWSDEIQQEWIRNLLRNRPDLSEKKLERTVNAMNIAFPDANIQDFEELIAGLNLPDENDRHVLACAIKVSANAICTFNTKDFPKNNIAAYEIEVQTPDLFICNLLELNYELSCLAFDKMVDRLVNPPKSKDEVLITLHNCGLINASNRLKTNYR